MALVGLSTELICHLHFGRVSHAIQVRRKNNFEP